ncbi:hypothetical protein PU629_05375 [Pullulanibacillus sp. KACC 23026]|uniref:restriction endonuclease n=1 Tax=Pullulanibacillus sp. KACC 23026 TaxID=3028315 RepID=UPI0023B16520|nr:hypothetical protein [Pullulanibacillus sp. KACC 23026]WEG13798.1 hypothetical protein PU629_05375 [Pullulanibacillus sp. KACC 23026]
MDDIMNELPIVKIDSSRNYWLVRTQAGQYHDQFYFEEYVAIGWNEFNDPRDFEGNNDDAIKKDIEKVYPDSKQPGLIFGQIKRFYHEIKVGDVVIIPTENSTHVSFGTIESHPFIEEISETDIEEGVCPFQKRRKVDWIKTVKRADLDPYLYRLLHSNQTISNANAYAPFIDRTLHSLYIKNGQANLVIPIKKQGKIPALDLIDFVNSMVNLVDEVNLLELTNEKFNKRKDLDIKLNVQSPGIVHFFSDSPYVILGIGVLLVFIVGGKFKATFTKDKTDVEASSTGLMGMFLKFKSQKNDHEIKKLEIEHKQAMERVQAEIPEEIKNLLTKIDGEGE